MPSLRNKCHDCPLSRIQQELPVYSVEAIDRQNTQVTRAVLRAAGLEGGHWSNAKVVNRAAKECVRRVTEGECPTFSRSSRGFTFIKKQADK